MNENTFEILAMDQEGQELRMIGEHFDIVISLEKIEDLYDLLTILAPQPFIQVTVREKE